VKHWADKLDIKVRWRLWAHEETSGPPAQRTAISILNELLGLDRDVGDYRDRPRTAPLRGPAHGKVVEEFNASSFGDYERLKTVSLRAR